MCKKGTKQPGDHGSGPYAPGTKDPGTNCHGTKIMPCMFSMIACRMLIEIM